MSAWGDEFTRAVNESYDRLFRSTRVGSCVPEYSREPLPPPPPSTEHYPYIDDLMADLAATQVALLVKLPGWRGWVVRRLGLSVVQSYAAMVLGNILRQLEERDVVRALKTRAMIDAYDPPKPRETSVRPKRWGEGGTPE